MDELKTLEQAFVSALCAQGHGPQAETDMSRKWKNDGLCHCTGAELEAMTKTTVGDCVILTGGEPYGLPFTDGMRDWPKVEEIAALAPRVCAEMRHIRSMGRRDLERTALDRLGLSPGLRRWGRRRQGMTVLNCVVNNIRKAAGGRLGEPLKWPPLRVQRWISRETAREETELADAESMPNRC
ncbi:MAG: hypothetical protein OXF68_02565 [Gammaproteobacteria bacterium]|nr:hypothetical protein [Gammaproteobacteria bacterium]